MHTEHVGVWLRGATRSAEREQNGCSKASPLEKKNLHGNKSYNLSAVCTLDWLRAITPTKKAFFFSHSTLLLLLPAIPLLPCVKLILWTFWKIFLFFRRVKALAVVFSPLAPLSFISVMAPGRGDCLPSETAVKNSQRLHALPPRSLFYLTKLPPPTTQPPPLPRSPRPYLLLRWDPHRCWLIEGGDKESQRRRVRRSKSGD